MKKKLTLLTTIFCFIFTPEINASHILGGEITWACTGMTGQSQYVFYLTVYRDCSGATWNYSNETLQVFGNPLPKDSLSNTNITSIIVKPDSSKWSQLNNGDMSPSCSSGAIPSFSCSSGDPGTIQAFYYKSDPVNMKGTPPASGWKFGWESFCCRPNLRNLAGGASGVITLRAFMYPDKNNTNVMGCIDSSPEFKALPISSICKEKVISNNHSAVDYELDSLAFAWDRTYDAPLSNPTPRAYAAGFNYNNPTPDSLFDIRNVAATLDPNTGIKSMKVYSGNSADKYLTVVRVDAYREGTKIASVFREVPLVFYNCPPIGSTTPNNQPEFYFDSIKQKVYEIVVEAGDKVEFPIQAMDSDSSASGIPQQITLIPYGSQFSNDLSDTTACFNPPCAILKNGAPQYDSSRMRYKLTGRNSVLTNFEWQTNCGHINVDGTPKTYYFYFSAKDDHCPFPQQVDTYVKVIVGGEGAKDGPFVECVRERANGTEINWFAAQSLSNNFTNWYVFAGDSAHQLQLIDSISSFSTQTYFDTAFFDFYQIKTNTNCGSTLAILQSDVVDSKSQKEEFIHTITENNQQLIADDSLADSYQWYDCLAATIIPSSTNRTFTPTTGGTYAAILTKGLCVDTTNCVTISTVSLNENSFQHNVRFYPNPSSGLVNFEFPQKQQSLQVKVRNIHGQLVQEKQFVNQGNLQLQLNGKAGIYFIELVNEKGERANVKVVKR